MHNMNLKQHPTFDTLHWSLFTRHSPFCILHSAFCIAALAAFAASAANYSLTVASADMTKGSVSAVDGTYPEGTAVTVTATPEAGWTFTRWDGVVPSLRLDNPLVLSVTNNTAVTAVFGKTHYVATNGSDSTADGTNPATPYLTIEKAYTAAADNDTLSVGPGTFAGTAALTVDKAVVIRGAGMDRTTRSKKSNTINNANAIIADMRLFGQTWGLMVSFPKNGAGGTLLRCDVSGNGYSSPTCGIVCYIGNIVGCVVTNNINGNGGPGVGLQIAGGPTLVEGCLFADNSTGYGGDAGGVEISYAADDPTYTHPTILRHCTIIRNDGGVANGTGGLLVNYASNRRFPLLVEGCVIADNDKLRDETATATDDVRLVGAYNVSGRLVFRDTVIGHMATPTTPASYVFENCVTNVASGFADLWRRDLSVERRSPAWGLCADGSDAGCVQSVLSGDFDVGCYAITNAAIGSLATPLVAKARNAPDPGTVTFSWDLDGDGVFETTGPVANAVWTTVGRHGVTVRATSGGETVTRTIPGIGYVAPRELFVWTQSPSPAFPYATWETAAHTPYAAIDAALDGCRVQLTNEVITVSKSIRLVRPIEFCGAGRDNDSNVGRVSGFTVSYRTDANATGTCIQRPSGGGDVVPLKLTAQGTFAHSLALGPGRNHVVCLYAPDTVLSNCVVRYGEYTNGYGVGIEAQYGLITHCVVSNNYNTAATIAGSIQLGTASSTATLRNTLVTGGNHPSSSGAGVQGTVYAYPGCTVENCTIVGNKAGTGAGLYTKGAVIVRNNIIRGNTALVDTTSDGAPDWYDETGTALYSNNCLPAAHNEGDGTVTEEPAFILENGRNIFTFAAGSPCVNKGAELPWMTAGSIDLFGNARLQGAAPDIGCFEADMSQTTCDASVTPSSSFGATNIVFTAVVMGGSLSGDVAYLWDFNADGTTDATGAVVTNRFDEGRYSVTLTVMVDGETRFTVPKPDCVTIYPRTIYLATSCAGSAFPFNTPETAATSINDAIGAAMDGAEIIVQTGTHRAPQQIVVNRAITIRAADGLPARPRILRQDNTGGVYFTVGNPGALVQGLVIDNAGKNMRALEITASGGTVRDCVVSNAHYTTGSGVGLSAAAGLFDRGVIVNTDASGGASSGACGLAAYLSGSAVMRNSLVHKNATNKGESKFGVVYVTGNARMENCTVVSNTCGAYPAVYVAKTTAGGSAAVVNNIVWGNYFRVAPSEAYQGGADWFVDPSASDIAWSNNCAAVAYQAGDRTVTEDPRFRAPANFDFTLDKGTPCRNKGVRLDWMDGALDLNGNPRIFGARPDIGAIEFTGRDGTTIMLR